MPPVPKPVKTADWATDANYVADATPNKVEPSAGEKAQGWERAQKPPAQKFNWWKNIVGQWVAWLNDLTNQALTWTAAHIFQAGITVTKGAAGSVIAASSTAGNSNAVYGLGHGTAAGVKGEGAAASNAPGVSGLGGGTGTGVVGDGGAAGGVGVAGFGKDDGADGTLGGDFTGGAGPTNGGGTGVRGTGGDGVNGGGYGVHGIGGDADEGAAGVFGEGGGGGTHADGPGVYGIGGNTNGGGAGVKGQGAGAGHGVVGVGANNAASTGGHFARGDGSTELPATKVDGEIDFAGAANPAGNTALSNVLARTLCIRAWLIVQTDGLGGYILHASQNIAGVAINSGNKSIDVTLAGGLTSNKAGVLITPYQHANAFIPAFSWVSGTVFSVYAYKHDGTALDPAGFNNLFMIAVMGFQ